MRTHKARDHLVSSFVAIESGALRSELNVALFDAADGSGTYLTITMTTSTGRRYYPLRFNVEDTHELTRQLQSIQAMHR